MKKYILLLTIMLSVSGNVLAQTNNVRYLFLIRDPEIKVYLKLLNTGRSYFSYEGKMYGQTHSKDNYMYYGSWEESSSADGRRYLKVKYDYQYKDAFFVQLKYPDLPRQNYDNLTIWLDGNKQIRSDVTAGYWTAPSSRRYLTYDIIQSSTISNVVTPQVNKIYNADEVTMSPQFSGGYSALNNWIAKNLRYPEEAAENNSQGRAVIKFVIDEEGFVIEPQIVKSTGDRLLDNEALRVVKSMPRWKAANINGVPCRCYMNIPFTFGLQ